MEEGETLNTTGEFYYRRAVGKLTDGNAPRKSSGKLDFSGVWLRSANTNLELLLILRAAEAQRKQRFSSGVTPRSLCLQQASCYTPEIDLTKFVQTPNLLVILVEGGDPGFDKSLWTDASNQGPLPTWQGTPWAAGRANADRRTVGPTTKSR